MNKAEDRAGEGVMADTTPVVVPDYRKVYRFAVWLLAAEMAWVVTLYIVDQTASCDFLKAISDIGFVSSLGMLIAVPWAFLLGIVSIFMSRRTGYNGSRFLLLVGILVAPWVMFVLLGPIVSNQSEIRALGCTGFYDEEFP
jgi:hypothetical protein